MPQNKQGLEGEQRLTLSGQTKIYVANRHWMNPGGRKEKATEITLPVEYVCKEFS